MSACQANSSAHVLAGNIHAELALGRVAHIELVRHEVLTIAMQGFCLEQMLAPQRHDLLRLPIANTRLDWHQLLEVT